MSVYCAGNMGQLGSIRPHVHVCKESPVCNVCKGSQVWGLLYNLSMEEIPYLICWGLAKHTNWCTKYSSLKKKGRNNINKLIPNCNQSRGHNSKSIVNCCMVLLLLSLIFCLSGCIKNKYWLNPSKDKLNQDLILDGRHVRSRVFSLKSLFQFTF